MKPNDYWTEPAENRLCPLCGSGEHSILSKEMQHRLDLQTVICGRCSFVFTSPIPRRDVYERFYSEAYSDYYGHISPEPVGARVEIEPAYLTTKFKQIEQTQPLPGCRLLEVGPGQGLFLWWAQRRGCEVLGVEPSPEFCNVLAKASLPHIQGTLADVRSEVHGRFDIIFMSHVLEHFYDPNETLDKCRELLGSGGVLVVEVPNILKPFRSLDRYFLRYVHLSNFSPETLVAMLAKHGFQPQHVNDGENDWRSPQNLFVVARKAVNPHAKAQIPAQRTAQVVALLQTYRRVWRWKLAPLWYSRSLLLTTRRSAYRLGRPLKRFLMQDGRRKALVDSSVGRS